MASTFGDITRQGDTYTVEFERILSTSVEDAWDALTNPERLARWMAPYVGEFGVGKEWQALYDDGSVFTRGVVSVCDAPHRLLTSWHAIEEQPTELTLTVEEHPEGARVVLRHELVQSIDYGAGWQTYLERLDDELGAAPSSVVDPTRTPITDWDARYTQLAPLWRARVTA